MARGDGEGGGLAGCCVYIAILAFATVFLSIGFVYLHDCPLEPLIPVFLIVYGIQVVFMVAAEMVFWLCEIYASIPAMVIRAVGMLFGFSWMIAGSVWVFTTDRHSANATEGGKACDPVVYNAAFALVIIALSTWGISILAKLCSCLRA